MKSEPNLATSSTASPAIPHESAGEHVRNALAILRARLDGDGGDPELAADVGAVARRLERALADLERPAASAVSTPPAPSAARAATGHPVRATVELTWAASCAWLAEQWRGSEPPTVAALLGHWRNCARCEADAARAIARVTRHSWVP